MNLKGRKTDDFGQVIFSEEGIVDLLMTGGITTGLMVESSDRIKQFNQLCKTFDHPEDSFILYQKPDVTVEEWDQENQNEWFTPKEYQNIDILEWLFDKCSSEEEIERVILEWSLFEERKMQPVLRHLIFLVEHFREQGILWGVGRGSSVASYCLYLIGIHRINSLKFNLDPREFLK